MSQTAAEYRNLSERFLREELSAEQFQAMFLEGFKHETRQLDEPLFFLLDELFGDVDCYTSNPELLAEEKDFYVDEHALRDKVRQALGQMLTT